MTTTSTLKYTKVQEVDYGDYDPDGDCINGFITQKVNPRSTFGEAVFNLIRVTITTTMAIPAFNPRGDVLLTTRHHWSGYSEYTVTNVWSEIILTVPASNWEHEWPSLGDFLRDMADANPAKGH